MNETLAASTDLALALECVAFTALLRRERAPRGTSGFFAALGAAALFGAVAHGSGECSALRPLAFRVALLALGVAAAAFALYAVALASAPRSFGFAAAACLPGFVVLLLALARHALLERTRAALLATLGLATMLAATGLQQLGVALDPIGLDRNALFHALSMLALAPLYGGLRRISWGKEASSC